MTKKRRHYRPDVLTLEARSVLSTFGNPWPNPGDISISFTPDGTKDGLQSSALYQTLQGLNVNGNDWQLTMLRAFQTWATQANINFTVESDNGAAFGTTGAIQGDSRFGDIRVGAIAQSPATLALTQPFDYQAGTWAGDVNLNASYSFGINDSKSLDLFTVALHEAGHSLGLNVNTTDPSSIMYQYYTGPKTQLSASDITALRAVYPAGADTSNNSFSTASPITPVSIFGLNSLSTTVTVQDRLATPTSDDFYVLNTSTIPTTNPGPYHVDLKTSSISLLEATLTVYDAKHNVIAKATASDPRNGDISLALPAQAAGSTYYFSVQGANRDAFSVGAYQLKVVPDSIGWSINALSDALTAASSQIASQATNTTFSSALELSSWLTQNGPQNYFEQGTIGAVLQSRYYALTSPGTMPAGSPDVLTVSVWGTDTTALDALATVYDSNDNVVSSTVIQHTAGNFVVQIPKVSLGSTYYIKVSAYDPGNTTALGNFDLSASFGSTVDGLSTIKSGTLTPQTNGFSAQPKTTFSLSHDTLYDFGLAATSGSANESVVLILTDSSGNAVTTLKTKANQLQSLQVWLVAGTYSISITGINTTPFMASPLGWVLTGDDLSSPIRVYGSPGGGSTPPQR